jgi:hypothetical protein
LLPHFQRWCAEGLMTAHVHQGQWENLGTVAEFTDLNQRLYVNSHVSPHLNPHPNSPVNSLLVP